MSGTAYREVHGTATGRFEGGLLSAAMFRLRIEQPVIFGMWPDPKPFDLVALHHRERAKVGAYPGGPSNRPPS